MTTSQNDFALLVGKPKQDQGKYAAAWANTITENLSYLLALNCLAIKNSIEDYVTISKKIYNARTPQKFIDLNTDILHTYFNRTLTYANFISGIGSHLHSELNDAVQIQIYESRKVSKNLGNILEVPENIVQP